MDTQLDDVSALVEVALDEGEGIIVGKPIGLLVGASVESVDTTVGGGGLRIIKVGSIVGVKVCLPLGIETDGFMDGAVVGIEFESSSAMLG